MSKSVLEEIHAASFHPVIPFDASRDRLLSLDLSVSNKDLAEEVLADTGLFSDHIDQQLAGANARFGIGGYDEHRLVYGNSAVFDGASPADEPRRLHLGTDIWGKPYTAVIAPFDGIVHSFAFNNSPGDYGATIILTHHLQTTSFYTLYGHLSLNSLKNRTEGEHIEQGEIFAEFGIPSENGSWPPHLHFQLILDLGNWKGDYPGVCKYSEKEKWLLNSPDPDIVLRLNRYLGK